MKQCNICLNLYEENIDNFYKRKSGKFDAQCRNCLCNLSKEYFKLNSQKSIKDNTRRRLQRVLKNRLYVFCFLKQKKCIDCGESNILTLEFDHIDPSCKKYTISWMICQGLSLDKLKEEILKCEVRCGNCHKIKTAKQQNWYRYLFNQSNL